MCFTMRYMVFLEFLVHCLYILCYDTRKNTKALFDETIICKQSKRYIDGEELEYHGNKKSHYRFYTI